MGDHVAGSAVRLAGAGTPGYVGLDTLSLVIFAVAFGVFVLEQTVAAIAKTAVYHHATDGDSPAEFEGMALSEVLG